MADRRPARLGKRASYPVWANWLGSLSAVTAETAILHLRDNAVDRLEFAGHLLELFKS